MLHKRVLARGTLSIAFNVTALVGNLVLEHAVLQHLRRVPRLSQVSAASPSATTPSPVVSIIAAARDEERGLRRAAASMIGQRNTSVELLLVNDRSRDNTGRIIAELAREHPHQVRGVAVQRLPSSWLGKNHALWLGARHASGAWLLFTDADIHFDPTTVSRAIAYAEANQLDHLTLIPGIDAQGYWLRAFISFIFFAFVSTQRPYLAREAASDTGVGVGAFNLIRRAAYDTIGTHAALSLRPDDDMRLGQRVKQFGLRQQVLSGTDLVRVEWYTSLTRAIRGMEKNQFANVDYSVMKLLARVAALYLMTVFPYASIWWTAGLARSIPLAAIGLHSLNYFTVCHHEEEAVAPYVPALPVTALLCGFAVMRSAWASVTNNGIVWRDTFYPLALLRSQTGFEHNEHDDMNS